MGPVMQRPLKILYDPAVIPLNYSMYSGGISTLPLSTNSSPMQEHNIEHCYHSETEAISRIIPEEMERSGIYDDPIVTEITPCLIFYRAEDYHQKHYEKCPVRYKI